MERINYEHDQLLAQPKPFYTQSVTIESGQTLLRGAVLGKTAAGKYKLSAYAASDGSQKPCAICAEDIDATAEDTPAVVFIAGNYLETSLIYGEGHTSATAWAALAENSIYIQEGC